ncbi:hypothetical protein FHS35_001600 [Streptomyces umbrinus]|uniref:hypothetical protein n=1 Tax=Streptomyces umbrinus TaxID=67370 RepID=UPI00167E8AFB|nr:hypothetical protein [Streptomyces umbrinus]MCR3724752.1 hypothetical protein [Streptomyces umbrinus]
MPTARLLTLTCNATEDWMGDDEVLVKVFGTRYGEAYRPMNNHQTWDINLDAPFGTDSRMRIEVWDKDLGWWLDPDDLLGVHYVNASQAGTGQKSAEFNADEASYTLVYEVVA